MATPIIDQVSKDLAYKLQDPVTSGDKDHDGARISAAERFRYILRGYRRLVRAVTSLYPEMYNSIFWPFATEVGFTTNSAGVLSLSTYNIAEVHEVLAKEPAQEDYVRATKLSPEEWLSTAGSVNAFYSPNLNNRTYYWIREATNLTLTPPVTFNVKLSLRWDRAKQMEASGQGGTYDIDMLTESLDLLLALAATEAYLDIGQPDLANAYLSDFTNQMQLLTTKIQREKARNEI